MLGKIRLICATKKSREAFFESAALGRSISLYRFPFIELRLFERNAQGLSSVYNNAIAEAVADPAILVFVHDDVHLCDFYWFDYLMSSLRVFDIVGLAGNRRRIPRQPGWCFVDAVDGKLRPDQSENLSGVVAHGRGFPEARISYFGRPGQEVKLLDGLLLATKSETLIAKGLRFDERFDFHFYDMDFCRQAEILGLKMGTWSISVIHESGGHFGGEGWQAGYAKYLEKWKE